MKKIYSIEFFKKIALKTTAQKLAKAAFVAIASHEFAHSTCAMSNVCVLRGIARGAVMAGIPPYPIQARAFPVEVMAFRA